jgi:hypothetical protein
MATRDARGMSATASWKPHAPPARRTRLENNAKDLAPLPLDTLAKLHLDMAPAADEA